MKIGDNVKVKSTLIPNQIYGGAMFVPEMEEFLGKGAIVTELLFPVTNVGEDSYGLSLDIYQQYEFTNEMLEMVGVS